MKALLAILIVTHTITASLSAREWTSADGSRTFQGEFISFADGKVTVRRSDGKNLVFAIGLLSVFASTEGPLPRCRFSSRHDWVNTARD